MPVRATTMFVPSRTEVVTSLDDPGQDSDSRQWNGEESLGTLEE